MSLSLRIGSYALLALLAFAVGWSVQGWKRDSEALLIERAADAVEARTATRISGIRVVNQTIQGQVREVIRDNPVYRDCELPGDMQRLLDAAREGRAEPLSDRGSVPATGQSTP